MSWNHAKIQKQASRGVLKKMYSENTQELINTHAEVWFQPHFGMGIFL